MRFACATGFIARSELHDPAGGPFTLVDRNGEAVFTLRGSHRRLAHLVGQPVRVCGTLRGTVCGSARNLEVTDVGPGHFIESAGPNGSAHLLSPVLVQSNQPLFAPGRPPRRHR